MYCFKNIFPRFKPEIKKQMKPISGFHPFLCSFPKNKNAATINSISAPLLIHQIIYIADEPILRPVHKDPDIFIIVEPLSGGKAISVQNIKISLYRHRRFLVKLYILRIIPVIAETDIPAPLV